MTFEFRDGRGERLRSVPKSCRKVHLCEQKPSYPVQSEHSLSVVSTYRFPDIFVSCIVLYPLLRFYRTLGHHSEVWASHIFAYVTSFQFHKSCCNLSRHSTYPILRPLHKLMVITWYICQGFQCFFSRKTKSLTYNTTQGIF